MKLWKFTAVALAGLLLVPPSRAADELAPDAVQKELAQRQEQRARQYRNFEQALLRLATRLAASPKEEDRARAAKLKMALETSAKGDLAGRLDRLTQLLGSTKALDLGELREVMTAQKMVAAEIREVLALMMSNDRHQELKEEIATLRKILRELDRAIRDQKVVRLNTETDKVGKDTLGDFQVCVADTTKNVAKLLGSPVKDEDKPVAQAKPANARDAAIQDVHAAVPPQRNAYQQIQQGRNADASNEQDMSIKKLEDARKQLEEILRQLREEERERVLAALQARVERMLQLQLAVFAGTLQLDANIAKSADKKPSRADEQKSAELSQMEDLIAVEAGKALQLLETEGSTVAFPEIFTQLRDDTRHVSRRLGKADVGTVTQLIEKDIIGILREMVEALKKTEDNLVATPRPGPGKPPEKSKDPRLVEPVSELKMVRAMQVRVNRRTSSYGDQYPGEQAKVPEIKKELGNLADRQKRIADITTHVLPEKGSNP
jgi:hypothetical protein